MAPFPPELVLETLRYLTNEFRACCLVYGAYSVEFDTVWSDEPLSPEIAETLKFVRRLPNVKDLEVGDLYLPSKRVIEVLYNFKHLERLEFYVVVFNEPGDLLDLMSQTVNLKDLRIGGM
ncbi:hypothetical protein EDD18DRAFT_1332865 [Armillaria luteobubalina]|uniref:Uncharacterized protein n=1 Tax=Armillaria luteobubalina TaxID=153913 RepID=A0AA39Q2A6_9AGAR|nr:hypothetical protein EDD18DRAFT_1332865 [Armillaria luteobubalina]